LNSAVIWVVDAEGWKERNQVGLIEKEKELVGWGCGEEGLTVGISAGLCCSVLRYCMVNGCSVSSFLLELTS